MLVMSVLVCPVVLVVADTTNDLIVVCCWSACCWLLVEGHGGRSGLHVSFQFGYSSVLR